jgi:hypothetical protein
MADVTELLAAEARRQQPHNPPPFEELLRTRRSRDRRNRLATGSLMLLALAGAVMLPGLLDTERSTTDAAVASSGQKAPVGSVTARLTLSATSVRSGDALTGQITVENNSGRPVATTGCGGMYQVLLVGGKYPMSPVWTLCLQRWTIPVGQSTYPVTVRAAYNSCSFDKGQPPVCPPSGRPPPPLPAGEYAATAFSGPNVPVPAPLQVTVTP